MKEYMKPSIEVLKLESEQLLDSSIGISTEEADVEGGYYKDSRLDLFVIDE